MWIESRKILPTLLSYAGKLALMRLSCTAGMDIVVAVFMPIPNRRVDEYGGYDPRRRLSGSITHRPKFPEVLRRIRRNVGEDFLFLSSSMSMMGLNKESKLMMWSPRTRILQGWCIYVDSIRWFCVTKWFIHVTW